MAEWHVWTISPQRYKRVKEFIQECDGVLDYSYPTIQKECETKKGRKVKDVPLYNNYIFINYDHTNDVFTKISSCPWIKDYIGKCSETEMCNVKELSNKKYEDVVPICELIEGENYKLIGTAFKGMTCTVVEAIEDKVTVSVRIFGSERMIKCSIDDIDLEG